MRIIAGKLRGKTVYAPDNGTTTRPTSDRAREMLFDVLTSALLKQGQNWEEIVFVDAFAGTGAMGIEALSRGAKQIFFFENDRRAQQALMQNIKGLDGVSVETDALKPKKYKPVSILFLDAPYGQNLWQQALTEFDKAKWLDKTTLIIVETDKCLKEEMPEGYTTFRCLSAGRNTFLLARKDT